MNDLNDNNPMNNESTCCLCGADLPLAPSGDYHMGNNPWPVMENGQCCNTCDILVVMQARGANPKFLPLLKKLSDATRDFAAEVNDELERIHGYGVENEVFHQALMARQPELDAKLSAIQANFYRNQS